MNINEQEIMTRRTLPIIYILDTSGSIWNNSVSHVLNFCDLVLLDLKMTTDEEYQTHIGCPLSAPLFFLEKLEERNIPCWIRHVVAGGLNDTKENIHRLKHLIDGKSCVKRVELLPFHKMCETKYNHMGLPFPFALFTEPSKERIQELNNLL